MPTDPRSPVIVGVGQVAQRVADATTAREPADLVADAARLAADDAGAARLLERVQSVRMVPTLSWHYADFGGAVADRLGIEPRERLVAATGGNGPQVLVNRTAEAIAGGELDVALIAGAETVYTRLLARRQEVRLPWTPMADPAADAPAVVGVERPGNNDLEGSVGLLAPPVVYPLFENALRAESGRSLDDHFHAVTELWARFSEVAAANPHAWSPARRTGEELRSVGPDNRMIGFPYPKLLNANIQTDQSAALLMSSYEAARAAGVADDRMVFPTAGAEANDHWWISSRHDFSSSPAVEAAGAVALRLAGCGIDDVDHLDLYSCFPAAVQIGARALGLDPFDPTRSLTVTGGLTFAGGPGNDYVTHAIATMVDRLRAEGQPALGLCTALGWYVTKHAVGVYSSTPPRAGFRWEDAQATVDAQPYRPFTDALHGDVAVETYTVTYERDGSPARAIAACLAADGTRGWATSVDPSLLDELTRGEGCGRAAVVRDGTFSLR